ncbi:NYN domain-containing protein [Oleomonas cavernae]|uniref:NYN domain-containing protein n=1 Tax=Oleomonas cavernae TaxID=2320859 RepID=A0A418WDB0_9PROT|nr:NYN domain-containing protein [Oleomonas cavernae]RJF88021.1 NYN domain-containing protein [Oleomonas cavernae]
MSIQQAKLAVLIDADNAQPSLAEALLAEIAKYGVASVKRIYGDWTQPNLKGWKDVLIQHAIQPMQQFRYTVGKNATDSALIIDAMDLLYTGRFDGFCLISSDSDFTRLASRLREAGQTVYGFGERKTPASLVAACDKFIFVEVLRAPEPDEEPPAPAKVAAALKRDAKLVHLFREALNATAGDDGWAPLGAIGSFIGKQAPEFDPRNYGYKRLGELVPAIGLFELDQRPNPDGRSKTIYVREGKRKAG